MSSDSKYLGGMRLDSTPCTRACLEVTVSIQTECQILQGGLVCGPPREAMTELGYFMKHAKYRFSRE